MVKIPGHEANIPGQRVMQAGEGTIGIGQDF